LPGLHGLTYDDGLAAARPGRFQRPASARWPGHEGVTIMAVARVTEIIAGSKKSFQDAIEQGIARASKTLKNIEGAWVQDQKVVVQKGKIVEYRVAMKVTFILEK
jgi:flavin-binding protein dodecin